MGRFGRAESTTHLISAQTSQAGINCIEAKSGYGGVLINQTIYNIIRCFAGLVWAEIKYVVHSALPKRPINQFKTAEQSRQQALGASSHYIYFVFCTLGHDLFKRLNQCLCLLETVFTVKL